MKIDEGALEVVENFLFESGMSGESAQHLALEVVSLYLAALPSAEPGRDRIAVVVAPDDYEAMVIDADWMNEAGWQFLEESIRSPGPYARAIVRCNLPRPAEPVEVEGSVEGVGP